MAGKQTATSIAEKIGTRAGSTPSAMDAWVGTRIKLRRIQVGVQAQYLADRIGISRQQLVKFETGEHRITAGRLWDVAKVLDIEPGWFFREFPGEEEYAVPDDEAAGQSMDAIKVLGSDAAVVLDNWARMTREQRAAVRMAMGAFAAQADMDAARAAEETG